MRLYGAIQKVEPQDDGTVRVHGIATSEAVDDQGEIVRAEAIRAAIPDYMRFPALREMHQLSAAGTTLEAEVCEDGTTRIVAHVVDPVAVTKVKNQVYRGFSIGGRVTQRDTSDAKTITGLVLNEISLVDRPANPEAIFDCWKAAIGVDNPLADSAVSPSAAQVSLIQEPFNSPFQIWACNISDHRHLVKAEARKCLDSYIGQTATKPERIAPTVQSSWSASHKKAAVQVVKTSAGTRYADPGYQPDGKLRYPIDTDRHIRAAWNYIHKPVNAAKYTDDQLQMIRAAIIAAWKAEIDKDGPPSAEDNQKAAAAAVTKALLDVCLIIRMIDDLDWLSQTMELEAATENDDSHQPGRLQAIVAELCDLLNTLVAEEASEMLGDAGEAGSSPVDAMPEILALTAGKSGMARVASLLENSDPKSRQFAADLTNKANKLQRGQALANFAYLACEESLEAGGLSTAQQENVLTARNHLKVCAMPMPDWTTGAERETCLLSRAVCQGGGAAGADTSAVITALASALGKQGSAPGIRTPLTTGSRAVTETSAEELAKALSGERAEKAVLVEALAELVPAIERLNKRVDDIARTPMPPLTMARGTLSIAKQHDRINDAGDLEVAPDVIAAALAKMTKEEQTLTLIKASYANPIRVLGTAPVEP